MLRLAEQGIMCVLIDMPMNLAIFDVNAANDVYDKYPDIDNWYLMGHSLGGVMASKYAEKNHNELSGLILLGVYPLNDADVDTILVYGSEDIGLDREKLIDIPNQFEIEGGNHSYFVICFSLNVSILFFCKFISPEVTWSIPLSK